jgi:hypothetical protein
VLHTLVEWIFRLLGWSLMATTIFALTIFFIAMGGMVYGGYVEFMKYIKLVTS